MMKKNLEIREREKPARDKMMTGGIARFAQWLLGGCFQEEQKRANPYPTYSVPLATEGDTGGAQLLEATPHILLTFSRSQ